MSERKRKIMGRSAVYCYWRLLKAFVKHGVTRLPTWDEAKFSKRMIAKER